MTLGGLFVLLVIFQLKHFLADYPLQNSYMIGKFRPGWDFLPPLTAHVSVHGALTFLISGLVCGDWTVAYTLAIADTVIHFLMDRLKAGPRYLGRFKALSGGEYMESARLAKEPDPVGAVGRERLRSNRWFWISLGFDQLVHHLTDLAIVFCLVVATS